MKPGRRLYNPPMSSTDFVSVLRSCAPYVHAHNGRVFVIAFGGEAAEHPGFDQLIYDIALLQSLGTKLVLVHGVRPQIDQRLRSQGLEPRFVNRLRVTDRATSSARTLKISPVGE